MSSDKDKKEKKLWRRVEKQSYGDLTKTHVSALENDAGKNTRKRKVAALKRFQRFSDLPATGRVNKVTLGQTDEAYCSFPSISTRELKLFSLASSGWGTTDTTYELINESTKISFDDALAAIRAAFNIWKTAVPAFRFQRVEIDDNPMIVLKFATGSHSDGFPFSGSGNDLGHGFPPNYPNPTLIGQVHFNDAANWSLGTSSATKDFVTGAAHEIGHALGLGHSPVATALMFQKYKGSRRFLDQDDAANIRSLYA